jgi:hypothetical protein
VKDYSEISDFELSKLVFLKSGKPYEDYEANPFPDDCSSFCYGDGTNWHEFDINNPSDMWPLIVENKMDVCHIDSHNIWKAFAIKDSEIISYEDKNPLRAAAIVFLMLNERE